MPINPYFTESALGGVNHVLCRTFNHHNYLPSVDFAFFSRIFIFSQQKGGSHTDIPALLASENKKCQKAHLDICLWHCVDVSWQGFPCHCAIWRIFLICKNMKELYHNMT